jgi:hypothetical protein
MLAWKGGRHKPDILDWSGPVFWLIFGMALGGTFLAFARMMWNLRGYEFCVITSILAMLPISFHFLVGLPVGIWALRVLRRPEIKAAFRRGSKRSGRQSE